MKTHGNSSESLMSTTILEEIQPIKYFSNQSSSLKSKFKPTKCRESRSATSPKEDFFHRRDRSPLDSPKSGYLDCFSNESLLGSSPRRLGSCRSPLVNLKTPWTCHSPVASPRSSDLSSWSSQLTPPVSPLSDEIFSVASPKRLGSFLPSIESTRKSEESRKRSNELEQQLLRVDFLRLEKMIKKERLKKRRGCETSRSPVNRLFPREDSPRSGAFARDLLGVPTKRLLASLSSVDLLDKDFRRASEMVPRLRNFNYNNHHVTVRNV